MKKLRLLIPILLIAFFLNGCGFTFRFFLPSFRGPNLPTEEAELPVGAAVPSNLDADDIYYRCKFAAGDRAFQYSTHATIQLAFSQDFADFVVPMHWDSDVVLDTETCAVNETIRIGMDSEEDVFHQYYRDENDRLVLYFHEANTDQCTREVIDLDGWTPYTIIVNYNRSGYPLYPQNLTLDPQTRILNDREVYLLTFEQTALEAFGYTGNATYDEKLSQRTILTTWYVDTQTNLPVQVYFTLSKVDDLLGQAIAQLYQVPLEDGTAIAGFSFTMDNMLFEPVEVPPVPDHVMKKAWEAGGFSAS